MNDPAFDQNAGFEPESLAMRMAGALGLRRLRWSLRRLHCPVPTSALVLEVGAGGNPYPRANVLLDAMESTIERNEQTLLRDRPLVMGLCEELPFKDKSFDFVIASHVLEHTDNPVKFLTELMRVGKAGYIETPEGWFEKMCAFTYHRLEVSAYGGKLVIRKKSSWKPDEIAALWDTKLAPSRPLARFLRLHPDLNHLRFYWRDAFPFEILNPETDASWPYPEEAAKKPRPSTSTLLHRVRDAYLALRRRLASQVARNKGLDISGLLRCPTCHSGELVTRENALRCRACGVTYERRGGVPYLFPTQLAGFNQERLSAESPS